jgi:uroporphyrinogen decarboxylase
LREQKDGILLTPRERCIRSILHEEPDRIPLDLNIRPEPYERLKKALGVSDHFELLKRLGIDVVDTGIGVKGGYLPNGVELKEGPYAPAYKIGKYKGFEVRRDLWGIESLWAPDHTYTYTYYSHPLQHISLEEYSWPEVDESGVREIEKARVLYSDYALFGGITHLWEIAWQLTGFSEMMRMLFTDYSKALKIIDGIDKIRLEQAKILCKAGVDVVCDGDDVGMQKSMMMSPATWRRFLKPKYAELIKLCHKHGVFFHFHSDGWIEPIIPDLVEIGVDILNPVQPECMDLGKLKTLYGDKLCFDGTIGVQSTLPFGTKEEVEKEVMDRIANLGPTGLIIAPTHAMQPDVSVENILALYKTALKYGWSACRDLRS